MYLLSENGRRHLLEFLRNLTPQALLLSTAIVLYAEWRRSPHVSWFLWLLIVGVTLLFLLAFRANIENFLDNGFSTAADIAAERDRLKGEEVHGAARIRAILSYIWRERPATILEFVVLLAIIYGAMISILYTAVAAATRSIA